MAPSVVTKRAALPAQPRQDAVSAAGGCSNGAAVREALKAFTQKIIANTEDVGPRFAEEARKMHFGETEERQIRGSSTLEEAQELVEDGVPFGILPTPPEELN